MNIPKNPMQNRREGVLAITLAISKNYKSTTQQQISTGYDGMKSIRRVYLDTNIYCRPLDDQKDRRIRAETEAFLKIVDAAEKGEIAIISSDYVKFEIEQIQDQLKRKDVRGFEKILSKANVTSSRRLITLAQEFTSKCNLGSLDALHLAAACIGKADFLLTCDDKIIDTAVFIETFAAQKGYKLKVRNPINYLKEQWRMK